MLAKPIQAKEDKDAQASAINLFQPLTAADTQILLTTSRVSRWDASDASQLLAVEEGRLDGACVMRVFWRSAKGYWFQYPSFSPRDSEGTVVGMVSGLIDGESYTVEGKRFIAKVVHACQVVLVAIE
ncbi:hypothetical protein BC830DRAFT_1171090 [Chytriomyces sp. MP71]|nr:hypothetical protein BC830DRAFT_1171090 [Chytriomyces sp. MP71]